MRSLSICGIGGALILSLGIASCDSGKPQPPEPPVGPKILYAWSAPHEVNSDAPPEPTPGDTPEGGLVLDAGGRDLVALDAATGRQVWRTRVDDNFPFVGQRLLADGTSGYGIHFDLDLDRLQSLRAWSLADGAVRWRVEGTTGQRFPWVQAEIAQDDRAVFAPYVTDDPNGDPNELAAFSKADGSFLWRTVIPAGSGGPDVSIGGGRVYVTGGRQAADRTVTMQVSAFDPVTGAVLWTSDVERGLPSGAATHFGDGVYVASQGETFGVTAFDAATGTVRWTAPVYGESIVADQQRLYVGDGKGLTAVDRQSGAVLWEIVYGEGNQLSRTPLPLGDVVFNPSLAGLAVHDAATGKLLLMAPSPDGAVWTNGRAGHGRLYIQTGAATYAIDGFDRGETP